MRTRATAPSAASTRWRKTIGALAGALTLVLVLGVALAGAAAPVLTIENAEDVEYTSASVKGTVNPEGQFTSWHFEYATQADFSDAQSGPSGETETSEPVSGQLSGLRPHTTYHLRLVAENPDGPATPAVAASTFETKEVAKPIPSTPQISNIAGHSAKFEGTVNPNAPEPNASLSQAAKDAYKTHWWFTCVPGCSFSGPSEGDIEADADPLNAATGVAADATGLGANKPYEVILHARNAACEVTKAAQFTTGLLKPTIEASAFSAFEPGDTFTTLTAAVDPEGSEVSDCHIVYGIGAPSGNEAPCQPAHPAPSEVQTVRVQASAGQFRLTFESEATGDLAFDASAAAAQEALEGLAAIGPANVSVINGLNNSLASASYIISFEEGLGGKDLPQLGAENGTTPLSGGTGVSIATDSNGSLNGAAEVRVDLSGLTPDSEYSYQLIATNAAGTTAGPQRSFRTLSPPQPEGSCPNEAVRSEQHLNLGECRAAEMVSPLAKTGANVTGEGANVAAATDGNAAVFQSRGGFAGTIGSGATGFTQYISRRSTSGWSTKSITPTPPGEANQTFFGGTVFFQFSDDLRKAIGWAYDLPGVADDTANSDNLYREDTESGALQAVTQSATHQPGSFEEGELPASFTYGASSDTGVASFASQVQLLPAAAPGVRNAYEWDHGTLRLAGILPGETEAPSGGSAPPGYPKEGYRATVSSDGSRLLFVSPLAGNKQLYLRRNHTDTIWVSEPESNTFAGEPEGVELQWVSPDAHKLLFTTTSKLLEEDENEGPDLYLYTDGPDPKAEPHNLKLISHSGQAGGREPGNVVFGASDDASRIYFAENGSEVVFWEGGQIRALFSSLSGNVGLNDLLAGPMSSPGLSRVSSDGRFLVLLSEPSLTLRNRLSYTGKDVNGTAQMYVYDAVNNTLSCASCAATGSTQSGVPAHPNIDPSGVEKGVQQLRPRYLSSDGRRVFFSTAQALVPQDTNGVIDTYLYETNTGHRRLITSGKGEEGQWFENASASGDDVFFVTSQRLVGADTDELIDLYDSRVGGGFIEPPPPPAPCTGDNCRDSLSTPPGGASPATQSFSGPGNPHRKAGRHHKKRRHKKQRHSSKGGHKGARR